MPSSNRCVFGCVTTGVTIHKFPNPIKYPELFRKWVALAADSLRGMTDNMIHRNRNVCDRHFTENVKNRNNRLNNLAVPTLHLPKTSIALLESNVRDLPSSTSSGVPDMANDPKIDNAPGQTLPSKTLEITQPDPSNASVILHTKDLVNDPNINALVQPMPSKTLKISQPGPSNASVILHTEDLVNDPTINALVQPMASKTLELEISQPGPSNASVILHTKDLVNDPNITALVQPMPSKSLEMHASPPNASVILQPKGRKKSRPGPVFYTSVHRDLKRLRSEISRLRKRSGNFKTRLAIATKLSNDKALEKVTDKMTLPARLFTNIQFRETGKKSKGRRFTNEEKILALSLYKRSPKSYSLLSKCFTLPSAKSLKNLLGKIKISPGINAIIFEKLKHTVSDMNEDDRLCTLLFDEMSINPQLHFDAAQDKIKGFTTIGTRDIADHVLTFMIRGVKKKFKQPVAYYFTSCLNKIELKKCLKEVIQHVQATGLIVIATICDQSNVNVGAIESLIQDAKAMYLRKGFNWRNDVIIINKNKIIPLYDTPHLLKGIRNNLITKDLTYIDLENGENKRIKWEYFIKLYEADKTYGELKILQKITEDHVDPNKINKMKVKTATQIFSHSVAVAVKHLIDSGKLDEECAQIAPFVLTFDKLFDSLNCNTFQPLHGKIYRAGVKVNSPHHKLWQDCIKFLKNMKFIEKKREGNKIRITEKVVPSIKNFIKTLEGMQAIWKLLHGKYGFDIMLCRNFNQDPIENFFGNIRSLGVRNVAPNTVGFEAAFKSLLLNNFCSSHSIKANCEDDMSTYLQSVDFFLTNKIEMTNVDKEEEIELNEEILSCQKLEFNDPESYVCGWILKKCCIKIIKGCLNCKKSLMSDQDLPSNAYIKLKEYEKNKKWLCYPSEKLKECFCEIQNIVINTLKQKINPKNFKSNIKMLINIFVNFDVINCNIHKEDLKRYFADICINIIVYSWCRSVNRILSGKVKYQGDDETKTKAQIYYNKHRHNKTRK